MGSTLTEEERRRQSCAEDELLNTFSREEGQWRLTPKQAKEDADGEKDIMRHCILIICVDSLSYNMLINILTVSNKFLIVERSWEIYWL